MTTYAIRRILLIIPTIFIVSLIVFADFIIPYGIHEAHFDAIPEGPSTRFWLGTDEIGADVLSRIIWGARVTILVGLITTTLHLIVALFIGVPTGFFGGKLDQTLHRFVDARRIIMLNIEPTNATLGAVVTGIDLSSLEDTT